MFTRMRLWVWGAGMVGLMLLSGAPVHGTVPPAGSAVDAASSPDQAPGPFVPGELIVKLKPGAEPAAGVALRAVDLRHPGRRYERVFPHLLTAEEVQRRNPNRGRRTPAEAPGQERRLENIYRVILEDRAADVLRAAREFAQDPDVEYAEPNFIVRAVADVNDPYYASSGSWGQIYADLWGIKKIQADAAWTQATGQGVIVAVSDTGLDFTHPDIQNRVRVNPGEDLNHNGVVDASDFDGIDNDQNGYVDDIRGWDFANGDNDPTDDHFHGTHVSGTIAAQGNNGIGVIGVAHNARILPVKFLDASGSGTSASGAASIVYAAQSGADVINMSWGGPASQMVADALTQAHLLGAVLVAAAGNSNGDVGTFSPASHPDVIAVASTDQNDAKSGFSNWGQKISVAAPGGGSTDPNDPQQTYVNILSLRAAGLGPANFVVGSNYLRLEGTSMASPHVAGTVALILSRQPAMGTDLAKVILEATATDIGAPGFDIYAGNGRINALAAVQSAGSAASLPELIVSVQPQKPFAAPGGPLPVTVTVKNVGLAGASNVVVELFDGNPGPDGLLLRSWTVASLPAGSSQALQAWPSFPTTGNRTLTAVVDRANTIAEVTNANNTANATAGVGMMTGFVESVVAAAANSQVVPSLSGDVAVWEDHRNEISFPNGDIYAHNFATGQDQIITYDAVITANPNDSTRPSISGTGIVWTDTRNGGLDVYYFNTATMTLGQEQLLTPYTGSTVYSGWPAISGNRVLYKQLQNYYDKDNPTATGTLVRIDLPGLQQTTIGSARQFDIDADVVVYSFTDFSVHLLNLASAQDTVIGTGIDPAISGHHVTWIGMDAATLHIYDTATGQDLVLAPGPGANRAHPDVSGDLVTWTERTDFGAGYFSNWTIRSYDIDTGATTIVSSSTVDQFNPSVSGNRIVWHDLRDFSGPDIYAATAVTFPVAVANLTGQRVTNKSARLNWNQNPEPDVVAYAIYRSQTAAGPYDRITETNGLTYLDQNLVQNATYYYRVAARNQAGWEGVLSAVVTVDLHH
ncbi:MAG TPA: S8 family serine peptidase [Patescibacteria group bacterium]|nr:S8 family serine peptidase [Patescibacteria group bacterium]